MTLADELRALADFQSSFSEPLRALADRAEAMEKDAERYRHMRASATFQDRNGPGLYWYLPRWNHDLPIGERLNAAIDAAMTKDRANE